MPLRQYCNIMVTFLVSGIWHGAGYLLWGLLHGILVCVGDKCRTRSRTFNCAVTFLAVSFLWSFFVWQDTVLALQMIGSVFTASNYPALVAGISGMGLTVGDWIVLGAACLLLWMYDWKRGSLKAKFCAWSLAGKVSVLCLLVLAVLTFGRYGIGFSASEFIYRRF